MYSSRNEQIARNSGRFANVSRLPHCTGATVRSSHRVPALQASCLPRQSRSSHTRSRNNSTQRCPQRTRASYCAGQLLAETEPEQPYSQPSQVTFNVDRDGPFPFRILYLHTQPRVTPGLSVRMARPAADGSESIGVFQNIPAGRLFTDAVMERNLLLSGSIQGAAPVLTPAIASLLPPAPSTVLPPRSRLPSRRQWFASCSRTLSMSTLVMQA